MQHTLFDLAPYTSPAPKVLFDENGVEETKLDRYRKEQKSDRLKKTQEQIEKLDRDQQQKLLSWLSDRLSSGAGDGEIIYRQEYSKCGKARCKTCEQGEGHGPYWYSYQKINGRLKKKYIGKKSPQG
ncbi:MAG: hypothetical protein F6J93_40140 [Oscillatoria sp. SIO1A7]|nr:hypothetical protein [Oscillatoria sp. SIO1A7]